MAVQTYICMQIYVFITFSFQLYFIKTHICFNVCFFDIIYTYVNIISLIFIVLLRIHWLYEVDKKNLQYFCIVDSVNHNKTTINLANI